MATAKKNMSPTKGTTAKRHYVEDRLIALKTLKNKYATDLQIQNYKIKANMKEVIPAGNNDYRTQISSVVKLQKDADFKAALPEYSFIPENEEGIRNRKVVKEAWDYWWMKTNSDKQMGKVIKSATTYGTGILFEGIKHVYKTINVPFFNKDDELEFRKERKLIYSGIDTRKVPFANFYINGDDIDSSTETVEINYYDMDEYIAEKKGDALYKNVSSLKKTSKDYTFTAMSDGQDVKPDQDDKDVVTELTYYNSAKDQYIIIANGVEILSTHIPYSHKELPYCLFTDNMGEDRIWGIGEFELLEEDEKYKNELRTLLVQGVKSSIGFILKDIDNDFDEDDMYFGVGQVYEVGDIEGIQHFAPNVPIQAISQAEREVDASIIQKSGVDINSLQTSSESATKTAGKTVSGKKRINDNIKDNAYDFYRRLGFLRMKNIQFIHTMSVRTIPIKGGSILNDGTFEKDDSEAFGSAKIGAKLIEGDFLVTPIVETMTGDSKQRRRVNAERYSQVAQGIMGATGQPVIKGEPLAELLTQEFGYDYDKMTQSTSSSQSGEEIMADLDNQSNGIDTSGTSPLSSNFIPPEQRSGAANGGGLSGQAATTAEEIIADNV